MTDILALRKPQPDRRRSLVRRLAVAAVAIPILLYLLLMGAVFVMQRHLEYPGAHRPLPALQEPLPAGWHAVDLSTPGGSVRVWQAHPTTPGLPVVVFFHGNDMGSLDLLPLAESFHKAGSGAVLASYRGYNGNSGDPSEAGLIEDGRAAVALAEVDGPVILFGHSLGAGVAADIAAADGSIKGLVLSAPFTSAANIMAQRLPFLPIRLLMRDRYDIASDIAKIRCPILIIHGDADRIVPISEGRRLAELAGGRAGLVVIEGGDHNSVWQDGQSATQHFVSQIAAALQPAAPQPASTPPKRKKRRHHP